VRSHGDQAPVAYVASGQWPFAELHDDAPISAHYGRAVSQALYQALKTAKLSERELARRSGISQATVSRILHGKTFADIGALARLALAIGAEVYPADLFQQFVDTDQATPPSTRPRRKS
jgi:predicted XRE-type DNA-binding protein